MYARLEKTSDPAWDWQVIDGTGTVLVRLTGSADAVTGPALASLVADHGFPPGSWAPDADGFEFRAA